MKQSLLILALSSFASLAITFKVEVPEFESWEELKKSASDDKYLCVGVYGNSCKDDIFDPTIYNARRHGLEGNTIVGKVNQDVNPGLAEEIGLQNCSGVALRHPGGEWEICPHSAYKQASGWLFSKFRVSVKFNNHFDFPVKLLWLQESQSERLQFVVEPNKAGTVTTYVAHLFVVRRADDNALLNWYDIKGPSTINLRKDSLPSTHKAYLDCIDNGGAQGDRQGEREGQECPNLEADLWDFAYALWYDKRQGLNQLQPSMVPPVTDKGFELAKMPSALYKEMFEFFRRNRQQERMEKLAGPCLNQLDSPTYMTHFDAQLSAKIKREMQPILEAWSGQQNLIPTSLYGVRTYTNGSILRMHVDTANTHVVSAIFNIDQDVEEDWKLEIYDHDGNLHKIKMEAGDMVFYESARLLHGRPEPLKGEYYANAFLHYQTQGWDMSWL